MQLMLTVTEQTELAQHEAVIERGIKTFVDVGLALLAIRDGRLYRQEHQTFEEYCQQRWGFERAHAYRMIDAARVVENVSNWRHLPAPANEAQARPLTQLEPEEQCIVWQRVVEEAHGTNGKITGATVQRMVEQVKTPHVSHNSGNNEWYTPAEYIEAARAVMGDIDLDPASSETANQTVGAATFYTQQDDGLAYPWHGRVWMNPPYASNLIGLFAEKLAYHVRRGDVPEACVLVNNATETAWFNTILDVASCVCFIRGRVKFVDAAGNPSGAPLQGQAVLYIGEKVQAFTKAFASFGTVLYARPDSE